MLNESKVYIKVGGLVSALGSDLDLAIENLLKGESGLKKSGEFSEFSDCYSGYVEGLSVKERFNDLLGIALAKITENHSDLARSPDTVIVISSSKGNIALLPENPFQNLASDVQTKLGARHTPLVISNACVSGILAINVAADLLRLNKYRNAIVLGIDALSDFVLKGFRSLFALSPQRCLPYDANRRGINLGEAAGFVILSTGMEDGGFNAVHVAGATNNDANHVSGPSRTGEGLYLAVQHCLDLACISADDVDYISAHGTSTLYNDEMESIAFERLGLSSVPLNSFKGYVGHTLGASGVVETILGLKSIEKGKVVKSLGCTTVGVSKELNVVCETRDISSRVFLKTGSGFGGCNAALLIKNLL
jgi:3-oxoacyl-[acyl-carrier-protein] synthase-1